MMVICIPVLTGGSGCAVPPAAATAMPRRIRGTIAPGSPELPRLDGTRRRRPLE